MWGSLLVYALVWYQVPQYFLGSHLWYVGALWSVTYVSAHVYEILVRGHCYLSADSTAVPASALVALITAGALHFLGAAPITTHGLDYVFSYSVAFAVGHVGALTFSALLTWVFGDMRNAFGPPRGHQGGSGIQGGLSRLNEVEREIDEQKNRCEKQGAE